MRIPLIVLIIIFTLLFLLLVFPIAGNSQEITDIRAEGVCRDFTVTVSAAGLADGCWDVKLDVPGRIQSRDTEWKSAFFYVDDAMCTPETRVTLRIKLDTSETPLRAAARLRLNSTVLEREFTISQNCPEPLSDLWVIIVALLIILIFGYTLTWWWRQGSHVTEAAMPVRSKGRSGKNNPQKTS